MKIASLQSKTLQLNGEAVQLKQEGKERCFCGRIRTGGVNTGLNLHILVINIGFPDVDVLLRSEKGFGALQKTVLRNINKYF